MKLWPLLALLAACAPSPTLRIPPGPMLQFPPAQTLPPQRPNGEMAQDFMDLEFQMESGQSLPMLSRFEGPITVTLTGQVPPTARSETAHLIARLHHEAGIDLHLTNGPANITIQFVPHSALQRLDPSAACFVAPDVSSLSEYRAKRGTDALDWQSLQRRDRLAVFIPSDTSPQEQRDCLHEEVAQALGPLNDLYRLPDSVFNDDNFQSVLTGFDMLMLRLHYAFPTGTPEATVAAQLPALLARLNPAGQRPGHWQNPTTPRAWEDAVPTALGPPSVMRAQAATRMVAIAQAEGWQDARLGLSYYALGRAQGEPALRNAAAVYATLPDGGAHLAHALLQLAGLAQNQPETVLTLTDQALSLAQNTQNAALMANLMQVKADALHQLGRDNEAQALRLDSLAAARYGFGLAPP